MSNKLKVVDFDSKKKAIEDKEHQEWVKDMEETCKRMLEAAREDRIEDLVLHFDERAKDEEDHDVSNITVWWNRSGNVDRNVGFIYRLLTRFTLMTDVIFSPGGDVGE